MRSRGCGGEGAHRHGLLTCHELQLFPHLHTEVGLGSHVGTIVATPPPPSSLCVCAITSSSVPSPLPRLPTHGPGQVIDGDLEVVSVRAEEVANRELLEIDLHGLYVKESVQVRLVRHSELGVRVR